MVQASGEVLLHIVRPDCWRDAAAAGLYAPPSLEAAGFIHLCTPGQLAFVLERHYPRQDDLLLLTLPAAGLPAPVRWEVSEPGLPPFPHLYGALPPACVLSVRLVTLADRACDIVPAR